MVVLPEKFVGVTLSERGEILRVLSDAARHGSVIVVAGLNQIGPDRRRNTAVIISPDGTVLTEYDTSYLLPGFESRYQSSRKRGIFSAWGWVWGVAIGKDMDFPLGPGLRQGGCWDYPGTGVGFYPRWAVARAHGDRTRGRDWLGCRALGPGGKADRQRSPGSDSHRGEQFERTRGAISQRGGARARAHAL